MPRRSLTLVCVLLAAVACATRGSDKGETFLNPDVFRVIASEFSDQKGVAHNVCLSLNLEDVVPDRLKDRKLRFDRRLLNASECSLAGDYFVETDTALPSVVLDIRELTASNGKVAFLAVWKNNRWEECSVRVAMRLRGSKWTINRARKFSCYMS